MIWLGYRRGGNNNEKAGDLIATGDDPSILGSIRFKFPKIVAP